ncbi:MAG: GNAT family N-acetyltransferase [Thermoplasmata archaeon]|nr:GNAT family N-acetyltransferase [Thermoplasmata archaeon]
MRYRVRNARQEDVAEITAMLKKTSTEPRFALIGPEEYIKRYMRKPYYNQENHLLLLHDGEIVGELLASQDVGYGVLKNNSVGVRISIVPEHLNPETVSLLLGQVEERLGRSGFDEMQTTVTQNPELERILQDLGFKYDSSGYWMVKDDTELPRIEAVEGLTVRKMGAEEIERFYELVNLAFSTEPNWQPYTYEDFAEKYIYPSYVDFNGYFFAELRGRFVGTVAAWAHEEKNLKGLDGGEIRALGVVPECRNLGIGKHLMMGALRYLIARGMRKFYLGTDSYNLPALRIYSYFGFRVFREHRRYRKTIGTESAVR